MPYEKYYPVRHVIPHLCGLSKVERDERILLMFKGFFDECNKNATDIRFVMAGWTASVEAWESFSEAWNQCLNSPPSIAYFKTSEANSVNGQFKKMSSGVVEKKKIALATVIAKHNVRGYIATVEHSIFKNKPRDLRKLMGSRIYDWAFMSIICSVLADFDQRGETETIDFIFDSCSELRTCITEYEERKSKLFPPQIRKIAGEVIPGDDKKLKPLQAADLLNAEHSVYLKTGEKSEVYELMESKPILEREALIPPSLEPTIQYAQEVVARRQFVHGFIKFLKSQGINLNDFK